MTRPKATSRAVTIVATLLGASLSLASWTQTWITFSFSVEATSPSLEVTGSDCSPLVSTLTFAVLASLGVVALSGAKVARIALAIGAVLAVAGLLVIVAIVADPLTSSQSRLADVTGIGSTEGLMSVIASTTTTAWPWGSALGLATVAVACVYGTFTVSSWPSSKNRYERTRGQQPRATSGSDPNGDSWEDLSTGIDPTSD